MPSPITWDTLQEFATSLPCVRMASFGSPVVPPVANHEEVSEGEKTRPLASADGSSPSMAAPKSWTATCPGSESGRGGGGLPPGVVTSTTCFSEVWRAKAG